jgi:Zn-dependent M28 family amino/carboxypeptidase
MRIAHSTSKRAATADPDVSAVLAQVSQESLRRVVETLSQPRHYQVDSQSNQRCALWIADEFKSLGYVTRFQGRYRNIVATPPARPSDVTVLVGAHYDSVPGTPGADDNASGVAALLECARLTASLETHAGIAFVAFNREEDGLLGSADFVDNFLPHSSLNLDMVHVLEMIGYCSRDPGSQRVPQGLPIQVPSVGDFISILGNRDSNHMVDRVLTQAVTYLPELTAVGLKVHVGVERYLPVLARSDHAAFWRAGIPALMWTDTAEFRNPHYHRATDTPDTLDYDFLQSVTQLLLACLLVVNDRDVVRG